LISQRDWSELGPKLAGKVHLYVGASDTFFLTNAVMDAQVTMTPDARRAVIVVVSGRAVIDSSLAS
jgi:hypothetical protein